MSKAWLQIGGVWLLGVLSCGPAAESPSERATGGADHSGSRGGSDGGGGGGLAGETQVCEGALLDCEDCPTLAEFRQSCANASRTACGGTMVGPLSSGPSTFTYCYDGDGQLVGRIVVDSDVDGRSVDGSDCTAEGTSKPLCDGGPRSIIGANSERIAVSRFNFFEGGYRFERRIDQLSDEQLELAKAIRVVPSTGDCWEDAVEMSVSVTTGNDVQLFGANQYTGTCGREKTLVDFDAVSALLATVQCLSAKGYEASSVESAPSIQPDDGCWHGLFNAYGASAVWWFVAEIPSAGEYQFATTDCGDRGLALDLFEEDATTELAGANGDGDCPTLNYTFAAPGRYPLRVNMLSGNYAGDFFLGLESSGTTD